MYFVLHGPSINIHAFESVILPAAATRIVDRRLLGFEGQLGTRNHVYHFHPGHDRDDEFPYLVLFSLQIARCHLALDFGFVDTATLSNGERY